MMTGTNLQYRSVIYLLNSDGFERIDGTSFTTGRQCEYHATPQKTRLIYLSICDSESQEHIGSRRKSSFSRIYIFQALALYLAEAHASIYVLFQTFCSKPINRRRIENACALSPGVVAEIPLSPHVSAIQ
jgi:hypothetical protein